MRDRDYELNTTESNKPEDDLDRALNTALAIYATVEAREGLEQRILANLRGRESGSHSKLWAWGLAAAVLAMMMVAIAWRFGRHVHPSVADRSAPQQTSIEHIVPREANDRSARNIGPVRRRVARRTAPDDTNPKLDVFPSPHPLSDQELALARYVRNFPADAKVVAEAQADSEKEVLAKMQALANESAE